jgi:DNA-binding FadR family transcriptional regulator
MRLPPGAPLDKGSPVPLYFQIAENLRSAIEGGALRPGDRLENEIQLSERLGVSRPTVRQAIQRLAQAGLVIRQRGVGTVVISRRIQRTLQPARRPAGGRPGAVDHGAVGGADPGGRGRRDRAGRAGRHRRPVA